MLFLIIVGQSGADEQAARSLDSLSLLLRLLELQPAA